MVFLNGWEIVNFGESCQSLANVQSRQLRTYRTRPGPDTPLGCRLVLFGPAYTRCKSIFRLTNHSHAKSQDIQSLARNIPAAHHALLPPHTNFEQVLHNSGSIELSTLCEDMLKVLTALDGVIVTDISDEVGCIDECTSEDGPALSNENLCLRVSTLKNTWTRAARRAAKARSAILPSMPTAMVVDVTAVQKLVKGTPCWVLWGQWRRGKEYDSFTSFWSHVSRKVGSSWKPAR